MIYEKVSRKIDGLQKQLNESRRRVEQLDKESSHTKNVLMSTMHEVRRFSGELSAFAEDLNRSDRFGFDESKIRNLSETIFFISGMISARLAFMDMELNPTTVGLQQKVSTVIYKKFDKARYVLKMASIAKDVNVRFYGQSYFTLDALQAFELVPFVLLDNAIKYSITGQDVDVSFEEATGGRSLSVRVTSIGPIVEKSEVASLTNRGVRGSNAAQFNGDGIGLYLAKYLCDLHKIRLEIEPGLAVVATLNGIEYASFTVTLLASKDRT
jgi:light-regulated signal transduction histidine kinase (bacteriophytochrome)